MQTFFRWQTSCLMKSHKVWPSFKPPCKSHLKDETWKCIDSGQASGVRWPLFLTLITVILLPCALPAVCCMHLLCFIRYVGFKSSGTGTTFLLFVWIEPDVTEPWSLPRSVHTVQHVIMLTVINEIKAGHFPGKVFLWEVTMIILLLLQLWSWSKDSMLFLTKY